MSKEKGSVILAKMLQGYGLTHLFYVEQMLRRTMLELEKVGIHRVVTHSEKAAAYMADGYSRAGRRPSVCMAQSVGAANLASGLQDAYLGRSPVIAITGAHGTGYRYRNAYQELENHWPLFEPVTKYNASEQWAGFGTWALDGSANYEEMKFLVYQDEIGRASCRERV